MDESREYQLETRRYLWGYFEMHASQRLRAFNFYLVISTVAATGYLAVVREPGSPSLGMALGAMLAFLSFVFWKLDRRNRDLIRHAEKGLMHLEARIPTGLPDNEGEVLRIFSLEHCRTNTEKAKRRWISFRWYPTYSRCFNLVFLAVGGTGAAAFILNFILAVRRP
jgi:hypothetical protein